MHDLSGPWLRHRRAQEHVAHVQGLIAALREKGKVVLPSDSDVEGGDCVVKLAAAEEAGDDLGIRVGEAAYNFRAALDYAVHVMSGRERQSQFPIECKGERFDARKTGRLPDGKTIPAYLKGVGSGECDLIQAVQPYEGVDWTKRLGTLSNRDKHRELVVVNATSSKPFTREEIGGLYPSEDLYPSDNLYPSDGHVEMHVETPIDVALSDGVLVTEALQEIEVEVGALLTTLESS